MSCFVLLALSLCTAVASTGVQVVNLSVDGRTDQPLGLGNRQPTIAWQMVGHADCTDTVCPADRQTAYAVEAAASVADLQAGTVTWATGRVEGEQQTIRFGPSLSSRETVACRVQVWDADGTPSPWSAPYTWTTGLLDQDDWSPARWIDYPDRTNTQPLPIFARKFHIAPAKQVTSATLYLSGVGLHHATVNGKEITDEKLAPGYSNYQLSSEYRTYNVAESLSPGQNAIGVRLGVGTAYNRRDITNAAAGRTRPYAWWQSSLTGDSSLAVHLHAGSTTAQLRNVTNYYTNGTINFGTAGGGDDLESRVILSIDNQTNTIIFTPETELEHASSTNVTGSGNPLAATDPSAGATVTPRFIGRLEITYSDGSTDLIVTDRSWRAGLGPLVYSNWYSGEDYDARLAVEGWDRPEAHLNSSDWRSAGFAPPPNLATRLVARAAEPVIVREQFTPISVTNPFPGIWVFDLGQNMAGWPLLTLPPMPAGLVIQMTPAESLNANGTVNQASVGASPTGNRGKDVFCSYTTAGLEDGEVWHPEFSYFAMQWVQVTGLPEDFAPGPELITGLRLQANVPVAGTFNSSSDLLNRVHRMARYSFASNILSVFTDCPGREKLSYPADYTMPMGAIHRNFGLGAFLRTSMHTLVEGQSLANTSMFGNVALKTPVYDWGYSGRFGDEINWGNAIVLVPSLLNDLYGDTDEMDQYYEQMTDFVEYIRREKVKDNIVDAALADWIAADESTSGRITGTWGYYLTIRAMARMANITGHLEDVGSYEALAAEIRDAFNAAFFDEELGYYVNQVGNSSANATQAAQALALDAGLVPEDHRSQVLDKLVNLTYEWPSEDGIGPHLTGGTISLSSIIRVLTAAGHDDLLWEFMQQTDYPSYGYLLAPTEENPNGLTTIGENWDLSASKNHMILAQIDEWFHAGIAGIQPMSMESVTSIWRDGVVVWPKPVGNLTHASGTYQLAQGEIQSDWQLTADGCFTLTVVIPANTVGKVYVPSSDSIQASPRATSEGSQDGFAVYSVPSGRHHFQSKIIR